MIKKLTLLSMALAALLNINTAKASTSSIMIDAHTGDILYEVNADERRYPASLTKMMTLYIIFNALENNHLKLSDKLKVSRTAAGRSPSRLGVRAGSLITVKDAVMAVIVKSANDCATVLAESISKSEADFAVLMTSTAQKLGMKDTTFKNASGLPNSKQKTTARDMAILAMALYHHFPQYYAWFSKQSFSYNGQLIRGHNNLLKTFAGADGMKTGYTAAAGYNIVTSAQRNQNRVIAVTMGHNDVVARDKQAALMMDKGLSYIQKGGKDIVLLAQEINNKPRNSRMFAANKNTKTSNFALKRETVVPTRRPLRTASAEILDMSKINKQSNIINVRDDGKYAVQVGSFSDYQRAKNHAIKVKNRLAEKYAVSDIKVEKIENTGKTIYRSKVVGLEKQTAKQICQTMKRQHQSCLVVAEHNVLKMAQK